ncbi:MAG: hypothetical protein ACKVP7_17600 [Hyphomicrobiaceae bacterium]
MTMLLIDDQGTCWNGASRELRSAFDSPYSGGEFAEYAVINLGFVAINAYGSSHQVRLRPAVVTRKAVAALAQRLATNKVARVVLTIFETDWTNELIPSQAAAMARVEQLVAQASQSKPEEFLARASRSIEGQAAATVTTIMKDWPRLSTANGQHQLMQLLNASFGDRYVVVRQDASLGSVVFHELGAGLFSKYETWRSCAVGAPVEEQPDRTYGRWIAKTYADAMVANVPRIEDIDAIVRWPHAGRTRLRYKRLLVPLQTGAGEPLLLSASLMDPRIDLRVASNG